MRTLDGQSIPNIDPPSTDYPHGRAKNSDPPSARNGTPIQEENLLTDIPYALLAVMKQASIIPNELPENINSSQFLDAILALIGITDKVIVDAPDLDITKVNLLCRYDTGLSNDDFNNWVGICESEGKLTVKGIAKLKIRNRTGIPVVAPKGTNVFAGDMGFYGAGYIQNTLNDNGDLFDSHNIVGELAEDFNFTDTVSYFLVDVVIKGKPMVDSNNFWIEDLTEQTVTPTQPGIAISQISSQWDITYIKDHPRFVFSADMVFFENISTGEANLWKNAAINNLMQIVSTNGEGAFTLYISDTGVFTISFYTPSGGPGSLLVLDRFWQFNKQGFILSSASLILGKSDIAVNDGEIWYDSVGGKLKGRENGVTGDLITADSLWTEDATEQTVTPVQPGIALEQISSQWDPPEIKDFNRIVFKENVVKYYNNTADELREFINAAYNNLGQLVSTNGLDASVIIKNPYQITIIFYSPTGGPGDLLTLDHFWQFDHNGLLNTTAAIRLGDHGLSIIDGDIWKDAGDSNKMKSRENGVSYAINNHNSKNGIQGGGAGERYHLTLAQYNAAIRWIYLAESVGVYPENVYLNENWLGVGDFVQNNWDVLDIGIEIGFRHGIVDQLSKLINTSQLYTNSSDEYRRSQGSGDYFGWSVEYDGSSGTYTIKRSDDSESVADTLFTMLDLLVLNRNILQILGSLIVGDRVSGTRQNGEIWYDTGTNKLRGRENGVDSDLIDGGGGIDQYGFDVENNSSQVIAGSSDVKVLFQTENLDEGGNWSTGSSTYTNGSTDAYIDVHARVEVTVSWGGIFSLKIRHNGTTKAGQTVDFENAATGFISVSMAIKLGSGDTLEVYCQNLTGFNATIQNQEETRFSGKKINDT